MSTQGTSAFYDEISRWPGVTTGDNGRMGVEFRYGKIELGHFHGRHLAHMPMPKRLRDALIAEGRATPHPVMPDSGWVQLIIASLGDEKVAIELFRQNYDRARNRGRSSRM